MLRILRIYAEITDGHYLNELDQVPNHPELVDKATPKKFTIPGDYPDFKTYREEQEKKMAVVDKQYMAALVGYWFNHKFPLTAWAVLLFIKTARAINLMPTKDRKLKWRIFSINQYSPSQT